MEETNLIYEADWLNEILNAEDLLERNDSNMSHKTLDPALSNISDAQCTTQKSNNESLEHEIMETLPNIIKENVRVLQLSSTPYLPVQTFEILPLITATAEVPPQQFTPSSITATITTPLPLITPPQQSITPPESTITSPQPPITPPQPAITPPQPTITSKFSNIPSPFKNSFFWPEENDDKESKKREKIPAVASSNEWLEFKRKKQNIKEDAENKREKRKQEKENLKKIKTVKEKKKMKIDVGSYVIFTYEEEYFVGLVKSTREDKVLISSMTMSGRGWKWPEKEDKLWYDVSEIKEVIPLPKKINNRGVFNVPQIKNYKKT